MRSVIYFHEKELLPVFYLSCRKKVSLIINAFSRKTLKGCFQKFDFLFLTFIQGVPQLTLEYLLSYFQQNELTV